MGLIGGFRMRLFQRSIAFVGLSIASLLVSAETITVVADLWCPYNCQPGSEKAGIALDILKKAFPDATINYQLIDWASAITRARAGEFDAIVGAAKSDAPDFIFPSKSFAFTRNCVFTPNKSTWKFTGYSDLTKIKLGLIKSYTYGEEIDGYVKQAKPESLMIVEGEKPLNDLLDALDSGKIDALVSDKNVFSYTVSELGKRDNYRMDGCGKQDDLYVAFSPANKERSQKLADQMSAGIDMLAKHRLMSTIYSRYTDMKK